MTERKEYACISRKISTALSKSCQNPELNMPGYRQKRVQVHIAAPVMQFLLCILQEYHQSSLCHVSQDHPACWQFHCTQWQFHCTRWVFLFAWMDCFQICIALVLTKRSCVQNYSLRETLYLAFKWALLSYSYAFTSPSFHRPNYSSHH